MFHCFLLRSATLLPGTPKPLKDAECVLPSYRGSGVWGHSQRFWVLGRLKNLEINAPKQFCRWTLGTHKSPNACSQALWGLEVESAFRDLGPSRSSKGVLPSFGGGECSPGSLKPSSWESGGGGRGARILTVETSGQNLKMHTFKQVVGGLYALVFAVRPECQNQKNR